MSKTLKIVLWIVAILLIVGIAYWIYSRVTAPKVTMVDQATLNQIAQQNAQNAAAQGVPIDEFKSALDQRLSGFENKIITSNSELKSFMNDAAKNAAALNLIADANPSAEPFRLMSNMYILLKVNDGSFAKARIKIEPPTSKQYGLFTAQKMDAIGQNTNLIDASLLSQVANTSDMTLKQAFDFISQNQ